MSDLPPPPRYDDSSGWSAMAKAACWLEDVAGITVEFIGRNALDRYSTRTLRVSGKHLAFEILIDGGWLWISATPMDSGTTEKLMTVGDGPSATRETLGVDLPRPLLQRFGEKGAKLADCEVQRRRRFCQKKAKGHVRAETTRGSPQAELDVSLADFQ